MNVGDQMECALLKDGKRTGQYITVEIREITRHWQTGEPLSVRVRARERGKDRFVWVQAGMLRAVK
jgi:hypothetical protein